MVPGRTTPSRARVARLAMVVVVASLLAPAATSALTNEPANLERGTITEPADGTTVISIQGFKFAGHADGKKPARVVGVGPAGEVEWVHDGGDRDVTWFYDVDPLADGNLLVSGVSRGASTVYEYDPDADEVVWSERFEGVYDTHDADLVDNGTEILIANMRNYDEESGENDDRVFVYDREAGEITWEWRFREHTNWTREQGGDYAGDTDDWTHVNDVDELDDGRVLLSVRNMDQVLVVNRSTKEIEMRLGSDDDHEVLREQHNPDYHVSENGTPTITVADSENDRVVEYAKREGGWTRTWELGSSRQFNWPRDADRLPGGNTLVVDSNNQRVVEVTPAGEVVWEFYAPWAPYDAERMRLGDEPGGPTIADQDAEGTYDVSGSAGLTPGTGDDRTFAQWLRGAFADTPLSEQVNRFADRWSKVAPWVRPVWMRPWDLVGVVVASLVLLSWGVVEVAYNRERLASGIRRRAR